MKKLSLLFAAIGFAASSSALAAVEVVNASASGYGLDLGLEVNASIFLVGSASLGVDTPAPLGFASIASTGAPAAPVPLTSNATAVVTLNQSSSGNPIVAVLLNALVVPAATGSFTLSGSGAYLENVGMPGNHVATGTGSVENLGLSLAGLIGLNTGVISSASAVAVDQATGLFTASGNSSLLGTSITIAGLNVPINLGATGGINLDLSPLGITTGTATVFFNEQVFIADGLSAADCSAAVFSCSVTTNALRIDLSNLGVSLPGLTTAGVNLDLVLGQSTAALTVAPVTTPVPEPSTYAMLFSGLGLMALTMRRRKY